MDSLARRKHDAELAAAIENASKRLPEGYQVVLALGKDSATVLVQDPNLNELYYAQDGKSIAKSIRLCTMEALRHKRREDKSSG